MARYAAGVAVAALAFGMVNVSEAVAAGSPSSGVHVDPNSPAGKQYVIPIVGARSETSGGNTSSGANPPAFGVGITHDEHSTTTSTVTTPTTSTTSPTPVHKKASKPQNHRQRLKVSGAAPAGGTPPPASPSSPSSSSSQAGSSPGSGSSDWLPLGAGGALVLLVGGGGGLALRRKI